MILFEAQIQEHQQLAEHYRELAAKREALAQSFTEVSSQAQTDLGSLKALVEKCSLLGGNGAIASLKSAVLNLFSDGDRNQPNDPTPDDDEPELLCLNGETGDFLLSSDHPHKAELNGQAYEWSVPFASPLTCLLEDAPLLGQHCELSSYWEHDWELEPLDGQAWEIATPLCCLLSDVPCHNENISTTEPEGMAYIELVTHPDNQAIAYQRKHDGEIVCVYVGFRTKAIAQSWLHFLEAITDRVELRQAKRMEGFKWEMKIKGMSMKQIERLAKESIDKSYRTEVDSRKPPTYKSLSIPQPVNPDEVGEGDIVTALLTPSASYKVIQVMPNGILDCTNLTSGDRLGLRPGAVT
ncbi:MAG: hypothetical protein ICV55_10640, partial [Coleofasciculus sp. C3-bin4]|nr:hypothetical protein [Coleofasciculus sp. C3-bin4]